MWPNPNKLLCSVKYDSFQPILLSTVRALGIVGKLITEPFEGILKATKKLLHCNPYLETIQIHLKKWSGDGDDAMKGVPVFETFTPQDAIFKKLFEKHSDPEVDAMTVSAIELISAEMLILLNRQAGPYLPGGDLYSPSEKVQEIASNVPPSNVISERDMAKLDNLIKSKPAALIQTMETHIMWQTNKPSEWLDAMSEEDRNSWLIFAMKRAPGVRTKVKDRKQALTKALLHKLLKKQTAEEAKKAKSISAKVRATKEIEKYGGLWTKSTLNVNIKKLKTRKLVKCGVIAQLKFHKTVLKSKGDKSLFHESTGGKKHLIRKLTENLIRIININVPVLPSASSNANARGQTQLFRKKPLAQSLLQKAKDAYKKKFNK